MMIYFVGSACQAAAVSAADVFFDDEKQGIYVTVSVKKGYKIY
jgi:hypothetical protein